MFPPGERRDGRRVSACAARTGLGVGVRVAALRDGGNVARLRVGTCVTGTGLRVDISGVVAVEGNEIPVEVPFTKLLAPSGLVVLVGAAVGTVVCVLLGPAAERSAVGAAVRS